MAREISYCDRCGKLVPPSEIDSGAAVVRNGLVMCGACIAELPPQKRAALKSPVPGTVRRATPRPDASRATKRTTGMRPVVRKTGHAPPVSSQQKLAIVGGIAGLVLGLAVALLLIIGGDDGSQVQSRAVPQIIPSTPAVAPAPSPVVLPPPPVAPVTAPVVPVAPAPSPVPAAAPVVRNAAGLLADAKGLIDERLGRYDEAREALQRIIDRYPDTPEAAEAKTLLADIDRRYGEIVDAEMQKTVESALDVARKGRYDVARSILRSLKPRYGDTAWFRTRGEAAIAEAMAEIDRIREKHMTSYRKVKMDTSDGAWSYHNGAEFGATPGKIIPGSDAEPTRMEFNFSGGGYVSAGKNIIPPMPARSLQVKLRGENCGLGYRIVDSTGQCHQFKSRKPLTNEWQEFKLELERSPESWGGANDKVVHQPIKHVIFCAGRKADGPGHMEIKDLVLEPLELAP